MVLFFQNKSRTIIAAGTNLKISEKDLSKLKWLFGDSEIIDKDSLAGNFIGPRKEMITPWSTNAVEITQNMGINGIDRIEEFHHAKRTLNMIRCYRHSIKDLIRIFSQ